jgi:hypothetical protein
VTNSAQAKSFADNTHNHHIGHDLKTFMNFQRDKQRRCKRKVCVKTPKYTLINEAFYYLLRVRNYLTKSI